MSCTLAYSPQPALAASKKEPEPETLGIKMEGDRRFKALKIEKWS